ncbi:hypothetical protein BCR44DRAFT_1430160 [Catenaria anguillulae PL171]|uniref:DNA replication complex GINS protein PSF1 n=1 Tax=Catenaria anguillulae PL171 TaxID=765915 RepID=A0A1Y2HTJ1_9FUNG|nr:hypothetical protein BCR44DRAFT_1430160 [Catenaria anguillulae PL171]
MYGDEALKLVREAKRTQPRTSILPNYNEPVVRNVLKELGVIDTQIQHLQALFSDPSIDVDDPALQGDQAAFMVHMAAVDRNKRCLLAYHMARLDKITNLVWDLGGSTVPADVRRRLAPPEAAFADKYVELLTAYKGEYPSLDLVAAAPVPPKDLYVTVRVVKDCGTIVTEAGRSVRLDLGSMHFLKRTEVERLITLGFLQHVE